MKQSMVRRLILVGAAFMFVALLSGLSLSAHHGWGGYVEQLSDLNGTVTSPVSMAGPHATLKVNAEGHEWDVVLAPPPRAAQAVLALAVFLRKPGSPVRRNMFSEWFFIDNAKIHLVYSAMFYPPSDQPVPNWPPYDGNFPLPPSLAPASQ